MDATASHVNDNAMSVDALNVLYYLLQIQNSSIRYSIYGQKYAEV